MAETILELVLISLKLVYSIITSITSWNVEERNRFEERMRTISKLLKEAIENKDEALNEESYLSNLEWEKKERYNSYKNSTLIILKKAGGITDLLTVTTMGMGLRVQIKKDIVIQILLKNLDAEEKSKWVAKELVS